MANAGIKVTLGTALADGHYVSSASVTSGLDSTIATKTATVVTDAAAVATAVATLVTDGASPTQAHVTTLNTAWGTLNTALSALETALATVPAADLNVSFDATTISTYNALKAALDKALRAAQGSSIVSV